MPLPARVSTSAVSGHVYQGGKIRGKKENRKKKKKEGGGGVYKMERGRRGEEREGIPSRPGK